jgi:hypothetical protein
MADWLTEKKPIRHARPMMGLRPVSLWLTFVQFNPMPPKEKKVPPARMGTGRRNHDKYKRFVTRYDQLCVAI